MSKRRKIINLGKYLIYAVLSRFQICRKSPVLKSFMRQVAIVEDQGVPRMF